MKYTFLIAALLAAIPTVSRAQYMDGLPNASNIQSTDITVVCQGGTTGKPGTCATKQAPLSAFFNGSLAGRTITNPTIIGGTLTSTSATAATVVPTGASTAQPLATLFGLNPKEFGAVCDGVTDDSAAFALWWAALISTGNTGVLPPAQCKINSAQTWSLAGRHLGVTIRGASMGTSILDLTGVTSGIPLLITSGVVAAFYVHMSDFTIYTNKAGAGVQIGNLGSTDALNDSTFTQMEFLNTANNAAAVALQLNGVYNCDFQTIITGTGGGSISGTTGLGYSLELRTASFSNFSGSFSGAGVGVHITSGYNYGNVFSGLDVEVVNTGVKIDSASAIHNTFVGGHFSAYTGFDFTAGSSNVVINPNWGPVAGASFTAGVTGMYMQNFGVGVSTPAVPATGVAVTNTTGRVVWVGIGSDPGGITAVVVSGSTYTLTGGTFILQPGDTISITYASGSPVWTWRPVI